MSASLRSAILWLATLLVAGCSGNGENLDMATEQDFEMQSICVGRYTIDIPAQLRRQKRSVDGGGDATFYFGHDENFTKVDATIVGTGGKELFESALLEREAQLREKENFSTSGPMFVAREQVSSGAELISSYASVDLTDALRLEVHTLVQDDHVVLAQTAYAADKAPAIQSGLLAMLPSVRALATEAPGFCVGGAVFDLGQDYEEAEISYAGSLDGVPVRLQFDLNTFQRAADEPSLVERGEANLAGLGIRPSKLRAGSRTLAGDAAEEWLGAFSTDGRRLHGFYAETSTRTPSRATPNLLVSFYTGDEEATAPAEMNDEVAVALWERMLASLRKRPKA